MPPENLYTLKTIHYNKIVTNNLIQRLKIILTASGVNLTEPDRMKE